MKKVITLSIVSVFCIVIAANAQINKGSIMLGGTIYGNSNDLKGLTLFSTNQTMLQLHQKQVLP